MTEEDGSSNDLSSVGFEQAGWDIYGTNIQFSDIKGTDPGVIYRKPMGRYFYANPSGKYELPISDSVSVETIEDIDVFAVNGDSFQFITVDREDNSISAHFHDGGTIWEETIQNIAAYSIVTSDLVVIGTTENELIGLDMDFNGIEEFSMQAPLDTSITDINANKSHILVNSDQSVISIDASSLEINFSHDFDSEVKSSGLVGDLAIIETADGVTGISQSGDVVIEESITPDNLNCADEFSHFTVESKLGVITSSGQFEILQDSFSGKIIQTGDSSTILYYNDDTISVFSRPDKEERISTEFDAKTTDPTVTLFNNSNTNLDGTIVVQFDNAVISDLDLDTIEINGLLPGETRSLPVQHIEDGASIEIVYQNEVIEELPLEVPSKTEPDTGADQLDSKPEEPQLSKQSTDTVDELTESDFTKLHDSTQDTDSEAKSGECPMNIDPEETTADAGEMEQTSDSDSVKSSATTSTTEADTTTNTERKSTLHAKLDEDDSREPDPSDGEPTDTDINSVSGSTTQTERKANPEDVPSTDDVTISSSETHVGHNIEIDNSNLNVLPAPIKFKLKESKKELKISVIANNERIESLSINKSEGNESTDSPDQPNDSKQSDTTETASNKKTGRDIPEDRPSKDITTSGSPPQSTQPKESSNKKAGSDENDESQTGARRSATNEVTQSNQENSDKIINSDNNRARDRRSTAKRSSSNIKTPTRRLRKIEWNWKSAKHINPIECQDGDIKLGQQEVLLDEVEVPIDNSTDQIEVVDSWANESNITINPTTQFLKQNDNIRFVSSISFNYNASCNIDVADRKVRVDGQEMIASDYNDYGKLSITTLDGNKWVPKIYIQPESDGSGFELIIDTGSHDGVIRKLTRSQFARRGLGRLSKNKGNQKDIKFGDSPISLPNCDNILEQLGGHNGIHLTYLLNSFDKINQSPKYVNTVIPVFESRISYHSSIPNEVVDGVNSYENILKSSQYANSY